MIVTVRASETVVSAEDRARLAHALREALEPFRPRVVRATLGVRGARRSADARWRVDVAVPLGSAGAVRVAIRGDAVLPCAAAAIVRAADAVSRRLAKEREQLLEFLFLASEGAGWPASRRGPERGPRRGGTPVKSGRRSPRVAA